VVTYIPQQAPRVYSDTYLYTELEKIRQEITDLRNFIGVGSSTQDYVYDDYVTSGLAVAGGASPPSLATFRGNIKLYEFPGTGPTTKDVYATTHILHGIKPGTPITMHVHWSTAETATAGTAVVWQAEYTIARGYGTGIYGDPLTAVASDAYGTLSVTSTAAAAPFTHVITNDDAMTIPAQTELEPDSVILLRLYRDPTHTADTMEKGAFLIQLDFHYQRDRIGTIERNRVFGSWR